MLTTMHAIFFRNIVVVGTVSEDVVVAVKWSSCLPSTPKIRVRIVMKSIFFWNICLKRSKINKFLTAHSVISYFTRSRKFYNMEYSTSDNMQLELYKCLN